MTHESRKHPDHHEALRPLLEGFLDGSLDDAGFAALQDLLRTDPDARRCFLRVTNLHGHLHARSMTTDLSASSVINEPEGEAPSQADVVGVVHAEQSHPAVLYAAAAVLAIAACAFAIYLLVFNAAPPDASDLPAQPGPPVATLIETTDDANLSVPHGFASEGNEYAAGDYAIDSGRAQFVLTNRVTVNLRGETRLRMHNAMNVSLSRGAASFKVPAGATGFTVHLPDKTRIVDLGTAFRVSIDEAGKSHVAVTEGSVRVERDGVDPVQLTAGASLGIGTDGAFTLGQTAPGPVVGETPGLVYAYNHGDDPNINLDEKLDAFTLVAWVRIDKFDRIFNGLVLSDGWNTPGKLHWQVERDGKIQLSIHGPSIETSPHYYAAKPLPTGRLVPIAIAIDTTSDLAQWYIDGQPVDSAPGDFSDQPHYAPTVGSARIGGWNDGVGPAKLSNRDFDGRIARLEIYNEALDDETVAQLSSIKNIDRFKGESDEANVLPLR